MNRMTTIAITSGKGGVGKTSVVVNLAIGLARLKNRVAILDADFGLGNVDVLLGIAPPAHLGHVFSGEKELVDILVDGPEGVRVIPASSGLRELTALTPLHWRRLNEGLDRLSRDLDFLLIDTAAGISDNVVDLILTTDRILVVTSPEPSAVVDAYALIKIITVAEPAREIGLLVNNSRDAHEAEQIFRQLDVAAARFLRRQLRYFGFVANDPAVRESIVQQRPVLDHRPESPASRCFRVLASRLAGLGPSPGSGLRLLQPRLQVNGASTATEKPQCA